MKISKRLREEAALICAIAASNSWHNVPEANPASNGFDFPSVALALSAWRQAADAHGYGSAPWAEAEALLRTGWTP